MAFYLEEKMSTLNGIYLSVRVCVNNLGEYVCVYVQGIDKYF